LRVGSAPRHMVTDLDDQLGRSEIEREWQDQMHNYHQPKDTYRGNTSGKMNG
jgi:hypothetical protein